MKRVVILGANGFFGNLIAGKLRQAGVEPITASRTTGDIRIDAEDPAALRVHLRQRDLVIDAAGPFQRRTAALIEAAARTGFDVIDLNDSPDYARLVYEREAPIAGAGIRILTACSALSTLSAAVLGMSSLAQPRRLTVYLRPASRLTANRGSLASFLSSLAGRRRSIRFPEPLGLRHGLTVRSVDSVALVRTFPSLREVELVVDTGVPGGNLLASIGSRNERVRNQMERFLPAAAAIARRIGPAEGVIAYEIADTAGKKHQLFTGPHAHLTAVMPAVMAGQAIVEGRFPHRGVVPPGQHVEAGALFDALSSAGVAVLPPWGT